MEKTMTLLDSIMAANKKFVRPGAFPPLPKNPKKQFAIFTCMDARLVDFLETAMGIRGGDAMVIKHAGNTVIDPNGGVVRSLVAAIFMLGVEEVFVIGHKDCGMSSVDPAQLKERMIGRGIDPQAIESLVPDLAQWMGPFPVPWKTSNGWLALSGKARSFPGTSRCTGLSSAPTTATLKCWSAGTGTTASVPCG
jgi:carbonic anhydrase